MPPAFYRHHAAHSANTPEKSTPCRCRSAACVVWLLPLREKFVCAFPLRLLVLVTSLAFRQLPQPATVHLAGFLADDDTQRLPGRAQLLAAEVLFLRPHLDPLPRHRQTVCEHRAQEHLHTHLLDALRLSP